MSIKNKLITAMLLMALVPLLLIGLIIYNHSKNALFAAVESHLKETASVQASRIEAMVERYRDIMRMLANRKTLKGHLDLYNRTADINALKYIDEAIGQIKESIPLFHEISVLDTERKVVSSSNVSSLGMVVKEDDVLPARYENCGYVDVIKGDDTIPDLRFSCHLKHNNKLVGYVTAVVHGGFLSEITGDYSNLGKTGEMVLAKRDEDGNALFIVPLRFDSNAAFTRKVSKDDTSVLITQALHRNNNLFIEYKDYKGVPVYGVTGYLDNTRWGFVVKMYKSEMMEPLLLLRDILIYSYIFIIGALVVVAMFVSRRITSPLLKLTNMAEHVSKGDFSQKISYTSKDETGVLVSVFNRMVDMLAMRDNELSEHRESLEVLVHQRTDKLRVANEQLEAEVSMRRTMTRRLMALNNQLNSLVNAIPDLIIFKDTQKRYLIVNRAFEEITGFSKEDAIGKKVEDIFPADIAATSTLEDEAVIATKNAVRSALILNKGDNNIHLDMINSPIIDDSGSLSGIVVIGRDITQRMELEHQLMERNETLEDIVKRRTAKLVEANENLREEVQQRKEIEKQLVREKNISDAVINTMPGILCLFDEAGRLLLWNKNMETISGYSYDEIAAKNVVELFPDKQKETVYREIRDAFVNRTGDFEKNLYNKGGTDIPFYFVGSVIDLDNLSYLTLIGIDITERKKMEDELVLSRERLRLNAIYLQEMIEEDRKKIARELHDDMSQSLTVLKIEISDIGKSVGVTLIISDKIKNCTGIVDGIIDNMHSLVMSLRPTVLDDFGLIAAIEWQINELQKRTGTVFEFDTELSNTEYLENLDKEYATILYRVFQESVTNVLRHADAEKVRIRLRDEGESIIMEVEDNGRGIDEAMMYDFKSLGIVGMRERVSLVGGKLDINKGPSGIGTKITVLIPLKKEED
ncbi:MAG: PAS domain S-box protein [Nitrospirae bacterium]|nr:PAS domain S-box protein [Nitrospirota bacterium]